MVKDSQMRFFNAFGATGGTGDACREFRELLTPLVDSIKTDSFGNVLGYKSCGIPGAAKILLETHIDQPGFMVTQITDRGFLQCMEMGAERWLPAGQEVRIKAADGKIYSGTVSLPPVGAQSCSPASNSYLTVDVGMAFSQAVERFHIGDLMLPYTDVSDLGENFLCGSSLSCRAGAVVLLEALTLLINQSIRADLIIAACTDIEAGRTIPWDELPDCSVSLGAINAECVGNDVPDAIAAGMGPVISIGANSIPSLARKMAAHASDNSIPYQLSAASGDTGTGAWYIQTVGNGIPTVAVSIPVKYMHSSSETLHTEDTKSASRLIACFLSNFCGRQII